MHKATKKYYALKEMSKMKIIIRKSEKSINFEKEILSKLHNKFIVNMYYAFQDKENLYLVMDYLKGGDLRFHLTRHMRFSEEQSRFFICNILTALEYIHSKNIIHRDIKPENLVLEEEGYARLTDFGIAKKNKDDNKGDTSGTPGYMAPEVMRGGAHSFEVDFFALGVIGYEFMKGKRPYNGKNRKEIRDEMLMKQIVIKNEEIEEGWTKESVDFINKLLVRKKENRLGFKGINEVKEHPWIKYYPWNMIVDKTLPSPFIPQNKDNFDLRYCAKSEKIGEETKMRYEELIMEKEFKNIFNNFLFNYDYEQKKLQKIKEKNNANTINKNPMNNIFNRLYNSNFDFNSINETNNKSSNKQLPIPNNKIIIDISKDKYNTINEMNNNNKKIDINDAEDTLYGSIFKNKNSKINKIFEQKLKNNFKINNKKMRSNSNLISNNNISHMNISLNNKVYRKRINISGFISPVRSDKYLIKNIRDNSSKISHKKQKQKSFMFISKNEINLLSNKSPSYHNASKKQIFHNFNKYATLLSKSNSYRIKNGSNQKNRSMKKIVYNKNFKNHHSNINYNLTNNISSQIKNKIPEIPEKKKYFNGLTNRKDLNNDFQNSILYLNGKKISKSKTRMYSNEKKMNKSKINTISNNNNNSCRGNYTINKTFLKENKIMKNTSMRSNEDLLISERNKIPKKKIYINNSRVNINDSIRNIIRNNSKFMSMKDLNLNNQPNLITQKKANLIIDNKNSFDKENINENLINSKKKQTNININEGNKERIIVNKRANNKIFGTDYEKTKYILNNNSMKTKTNVVKNKILKNKTSLSNLNRSSFKNIKILKGNEKEKYVSYRNMIMSYKQKNYTGK